MAHCCLKKKVLTLLWVEHHAMEYMVDLMVSVMVSWLACMLN
jgi:hypothetical protein